MPRAEGQLSPCAATAEPERLALQERERPPRGEAGHSPEASPRLTARESLTQQGDPVQPKTNYILAESEQTKDVRAGVPWQRS